MEPCSSITPIISRLAIILPSLMTALSSMWWQTRVPYMHFVEARHHRAVLNHCERDVLHGVASARGSPKSKASRDACTFPHAGHALAHGVARLCFGERGCLRCPERRLGPPTLHPSQRLRH